MLSKSAGVVILGAAVVGIAFVVAGHRGVVRTPPASFAVAEPVLAEIKARDTGQLAISEADGQFLRVFVATRGTKRALEIGGASGYSGIWIGHGLRETGGRLTTIEYDPVRAREAADNIKRAGLDDIVTVIAGDAFAEIPKLDGTFDMIFLDAWKQDYKRFFELTFPRLEDGGVFLAHNVVNKREDMGDFLDTIWTHPRAWSSVIAPSGEGMSLTYKVR
jgi:predicted O-methyltransferase YrrM